MIKHRTSEWYKARIGKFTASSFPDIMSKPSDKTSSVSKTALNCIEKAAAQLYFNQYHEKPDSDATRWGLRHEQKGIDMFAEKTNLITKEAGFVTHPVYPAVGATPDTLIIDSNFPNKLIIAQIKCPYNSSNHKAYLAKIHNNSSLKSKKSAYYWQIQGEIWVTGAIHSYFVSFDPRIQDSDKLLIVKINRDEEAINLLETKIIESIEIRDSLLHDFQTGKRRPKSLENYY